MHHPSEQTPQLHIFAISHYCEKARWALEYLEIEHEVRYVTPGLHRRLAKKHRLNATSLPVLIDGEKVIQGSSEIIDWAEAHTDSGKTLTPPEHREDCLAIEARLDDVAGIHTRRGFYSDALLNHPEMVKPVFLIGIPFTHKLLLHIIWPKVRLLMIEAMDLGAAQGEESLQIVDAELTWLETLLADGRSYLVGDSLTRADLTAASLFTRLSGAPEHPLADQMFLPPTMEEVQRAWHERPALAWIRGIYNRYR